MRCETETVVLLNQRKSKLSTCADLEGWDNSVYSVVSSPEPYAGIKQEKMRLGDKRTQPLPAVWKSQRLLSTSRPQHQHKPVLHCYEGSIAFWRAAPRAAPKSYSTGYAGKQLLRRTQNEFNDWRNSHWSQCECEANLLQCWVLPWYSRQEIKCCYLEFLDISLNFFRKKKRNSNKWMKPLEPFALQHRLAEKLGRILWCFQIFQETSNAQEVGEAGVPCMDVCQGQKHCCNSWNLFLQAPLSRA